MYYRINNLVNFRPRDGAIWSGIEDESTVITLTVTTSRLFAYLLDRQGEVITREDILDTVWMAHGLRSSNNSLNKYIADLRKVLSTLAITAEVIVTVPKIGFMISRDIDVQKEETDNDEETSLGEVDKSTEKNVFSGVTANRVRYHQFSRFKLMMLLAGIVTVGSLPIFLSGEILNLKIVKPYDYPQSQTFLLGKIDGCDVLTLAQSSSEMVPVKLKIAKSIMQRSQLTCQPNTAIYFQPSDQAVYGYPGRVFLAKCTINKDVSDKFAACNNYYEKSYTDEN
ncbi:MULTISPECIES: winged helix-turn-helix domain-containing protein [unclassified Enterobacter]|uniref:winged helix-turn-helix domain-containing protein n=1 Tax=unclassified Enterobacter TaxID=2608935 RepID=UPI002365D847|nr:MULTISPECIES: winged helix-turn-helix domain-containing protein [unclassified Enterobacter]